MKTLKSVSHGKPDAGNPHVRFDEREMASTKPRRRSLLCGGLIRNFGLTLTALSVGLSVECAQAGAILSTVPAPTEGGVYVLAGATSFNTDKLANFEKMSYVDWAALQANGLPDNAAIKFTGGVLFDSLPQDRG